MPSPRVLLFPTPCTGRTCLALSTPSPPPSYTSSPYTPIYFYLSTRVRRSLNAPQSSPYAPSPYTADMSRPGYYETAVPQPESSSCTSGNETARLFLPALLWRLQQHDCVTATIHGCRVCRCACPAQIMRSSTEESSGICGPMWGYCGGRGHRRRYRCWLA